MSLQVPSRLDGNNYSAWSQGFKLFVTGRGKLGYVTGIKKQPKASDPAFGKWEEENAMVMS